MLNVEAPSPLHGAALCVLFQRTEPMNCNTRVHQAYIQATLEDIKEWAATQEPETCEAYRWAADKILADVEQQMKGVELGIQVRIAFGSIARPPV